MKPTLANQDIVFNVQGQGRVIRIENGWAWLQGQIQLRNGGEPTTRGTLYEQDDKLGIFDGFRVEALLKKEGNTWKTVEHGIGSTDVWWWEIESRYTAAPRKLFPWLDQLENGDEIVASERQQIMNALRATVKREIPNQDIVFNVRRENGVLRVKGDYAWLQGYIELRGGGAPTTRGTAYEEADKEGLFDGFRIEALLKKDTNGNWTVANHGVGSTDVWWWGIWESHPDADRALWGDYAQE
ncbi:MAG: hypothetical protein KIT84_26295 [Labilithrix sp.]|nr:hypothetical protein [Labilithrix sp.]MCW5814566.1 hypothetical protein [Labilithrix sp.]